MSDVPVLETERLILREHRPEDLDAYAGLWRVPEIIRFTSGDPMTREQAWSRIMLYRGMWTLFGFGMLVVEEKETGDVVGEAGLQDRRRDIEPSLDGTVEAGWVLLPRLHGRGFAREAMEAVFSWAGTAHPEKAITCIIDSDNEPSLRLAGRLGFAESARTTYHGKPTVVLQRG